VLLLIRNWVRIQLANVCASQDQKNPASHFIGLTLFDSVLLHSTVYIIKNQGLQDTSAIKGGKYFPSAGK
jgi:hypothetical protein